MTDVSAFVSTTVRWDSRIVTFTHKASSAPPLDGNNAVVQHQAISPKRYCARVPIAVDGTSYESPDKKDEGLTAACQADIAGIECGVAAIQHGPADKESITHREFEACIFADPHERFGLRDTAQIVASH